MKNETVRVAMLACVGGALIGAAFMLIGAPWQAVSAALLIAAGITFLVHAIVP